MRNFYDEGWNAYIKGEQFDVFATEDWKDGWCDCQEAVEVDGIDVEELKLDK